MTFDDIQSPEPEEKSNISIGGNTVSSITIDGTSVSKINADGNNIFGPPSTFDFSTGDSRNLQQFNARETAIANGTSTDILFLNSFTELDISPLGEWVKVGRQTTFKLRNITVSQGDAPFSIYLQHTDDYNSFDTGINFGESGYPSNNDTGYYLYIDDRNEFGLYADGPYTTELQVNTPTININVWYELAVTTWDSNGNIDAELRDINGNVLSTISVTDTSYSSGNVVVHHGGSSFGGPTLVGEINL